MALAAPHPHTRLRLAFPPPADSAFPGVASRGRVPSPPRLRRMSKTGTPGRYGARERSKQALPQPGDELVGDYSRDQLMRFDTRFRERLLRAFETGRESREAA